jgi:hypothetical protein
MGFHTKGILLKKRVLQQGVLAKNAKGSRKGRKETKISFAFFEVLCAFA